MFCPKCGTNNADGAKFCQTCGEMMPNSAAAPASHVAPATAAAPRYVAPKSKSPISLDPKLIKPIAIAVAAVLVLVLVFSMFSGRGYEATAKQFVKSLQNGDVDMFLELIPKKVLDRAEEEGYFDQDELEVMFSQLSSGMGMMSGLGMGDMKLDYKINKSEIEKIDSGDLADLKDAYKELGVKIDDAMEVPVTLTITVKLLGQEYSESEEMEIPMVKIGNTWYLDIAGM